MSNYQGWTAGRHWREAMRLGDWIAPHQDPAACTAHATQALFHLAAARLLLDHPPVPFEVAYPLDGPEPPDDWRNG